MTDYPGKLSDKDRVFQLLNVMNMSFTSEEVAELIAIPNDVVLRSLLELKAKKKVSVSYLYSVMHPLNKYLEKQGYTSEMMATIEEIIGK